MFLFISESVAHALGLRALSHALLGEQVKISQVVSAHALVVEQTLMLCAEEQL